MKTTLIVVCAFAALVAVQRAFADDKRVSSPRGGELWSQAPMKDVISDGNGFYVASAAEKPKRAWIGHTVAISESEREVIRAYVRDCVQSSKGGKHNGVPQGLVKKGAWPGNMPEGWEKQCVKGQVLHAEIHKHCHSLPDDIVLKLPPPPPGTVLLAVNGKVVRVGYPTYEILDTFDVLHSDTTVNQRESTQVSRSPDLKASQNGNFLVTARP